MTAPPAVEVTEALEGGNGVPPSRTLILHYHLFKNAGTSIDAMLKYNFGAAWANEEFSGNRSNHAEIAEYVRQHPELRALSSHTALLPVPEVEGVRIFPIMFLRHPIDRLRSAYLFERRQVADTFGARLARETDFAGYMRTLMEHPKNRTARNFQTWRLSFNERGAVGSEYERAGRALDALPFVGLVEAYDELIKRLTEVLSPYVSDFSPLIVRWNVTRDAADPLDARLDDIAVELGPLLYRQLCELNADDIALFDGVRARYATEN